MICWSLLSWHILVWTYEDMHQTKTNWFCKQHKIIRCCDDAKQDVVENAQRSQNVVQRYRGTNAFLIYGLSWTATRFNRFRTKWLCMVVPCCIDYIYALTLHRQLSAIKVNQISSSWVASVLVYSIATMGDSSIYAGMPHDQWLIAKICTIRWQHYFCPRMNRR
jgi:hypothetical protein